MKKKILIGLGIVVAAGAAFFVYQGTQASGSETETKAVEMYAVEKQTPLHLKGQVLPTETQTVLISPDKGPIRTIHFKEGDRVAKDNVLVTYEWGETIKAAQDSIVASVDEDAKNDASKPLMVLKSTASEIEGTVTEYDKEKLSVDQVVTIEYVNQDKSVEGHITGISELNNEVADSSSSAIVNYDFTAQPNEAIPVGYSVEILIPRDEIHLPDKSVVEAEGVSYVFVVEDDKAKQQNVTVEKSNGFYLLKEGLDEGTEIIKDASDIKDGMEVSV